MQLKLSTGLMVAGVGLLAVGALGLMAWKKGGVTNLASSAAGAVVDAATGVVVGGAGAIGAKIGLPTPDVTTQDPAVARWIIDRAGYFEASKWAGLPALTQALFMDAGTGTPPPVGSLLDQQFGLTSGYIDFGKGDGW